MAIIPRHSGTSLLRAFLALSLSLWILPACMDEGHVKKPPRSAKLKKISRTCSPCHQRIYKEWEGSMHAKSSPANDLLVRALYEYRSGEQGETTSCDSCHVPLRALYSEEEEKNDKLFDEGVNCLFCHSLRGRIPGERTGVDFYLIDLLKPLTGPSQTIQRIAHDADAIPLFKEKEYCLGCHRNGEADFQSREGMDIPCQDCHMPAAKNLKSSVSAEPRESVNRHLFEGGHAESFLAQAVLLSGEARPTPEGTRLSLSLENTALHSVPTGFPLRILYLQISGLDKDGNEVWKNYEGDPAEDPSAYFAAIYSEEEELRAHGTKAAVPLRDTRLEPAATRELSYSIPFSNMERFRLRLFYQLMPERVVKKLGVETTLAPEVLAQEQIISVTGLN